MAASKVVRIAGAIVVGLFLIVGLGLFYLSRAFPGSGEFSGPTHDFGTVVQGEVVEHAFAIPNETAIELMVSAVTTYASTVTSIDSVIPSGGTGRLAVTLPTEFMKGPVNEFIGVEYAGSEGERQWLRLTGRVVLPIETSPQERVYFFDVVKGQSPSKTVEIISHTGEPLEIENATSSNPLFTARSRVLERGRRHEVTVTLDPSALPGKHEAVIAVATDSETHPSVELLAQAWVKDLVSTSLSQVEFSRVELEALNLTAVSQRTIRVEQHEGTDFQVLGVSADVPFLETELVPEEPGRSFLVRVRIVQDRAPRGEFRGTLRIETNQAGFERLELPISGEIL